MKDNRESLRPYVADMAAVEKHILEAVERQREDDGIKEFPEVKDAFAKIGKQIVRLLRLGRRRPPLSEGAA